MNRSGLLSFFGSCWTRLLIHEFSDEAIGPSATPSRDLGHWEIAKLLAARYWQWWQKGKPVWEPTIFVLTIVMLLLAVKQYYDSTDQLSRVDKISQRISTQYLNSFPTTIPTITEFINGTQKELDVMVDYAGYGQFSAPHEFGDYLAALRRVSEKATVRMVIYDRVIAKKAHTEQFPEPQYPSLKESPRFQLYFEDRHANLLGKCPFADFKNRLAYADFIDRLLLQQARYQSELTESKKLQIQYIHGSQSLVFMWLRDGRDAIFSFKNQGTNELRELSFTTSDTNLAAVFGGIFEKTWLETTPPNQRGEEWSATNDQVTDLCSNGTIADRLH